MNYGHISVRVVRLSATSRHCHEYVSITWSKASKGIEDVSREEGLELNGAFLVIS